jgi:hypothetical protein
MDLSTSLSAAKNANLNGHTMMYEWLAMRSYPIEKGAGDVYKIGNEMNASIEEMGYVDGSWPTLLAKIVLTDTVKDQAKFNAFGLLIGLQHKPLSEGSAQMIEDLANDVLKKRYAAKPEMQEAMRVLAYYALINRTLLREGQAEDQAYENYAISLANILAAKGCIDEASIGRLGVDELHRATTSYLDAVVQENTVR